MRNVFLKKLYTECRGETISRPFSKKAKLSISLDQQSKVLHSSLLLYFQGESFQNVLKLRCRPFGFS